MRAFPTVEPGRVRLAAVVAFAGALLSCTGDGPTEGGVRRLELAVPSSTLRPGFVLQAMATPFDAKGQVVEGRPVAWRSLTPATLAVSAEGLLFALAPGTGIARASVGSVSAEIALDLVNPPVASLTLDADTVRLLVPAGGRALHATARDASGIEILGVPLTWQSSAARIAAVSTTGEVSAQAVGTARITVRAETFAATSVVEVGASVTPGGPAIAQVSPAFVTPGQVVALSGTGFGPTPSANSVLVDGVPVAVTSATSTQLFLALPAAAAFACEPTRSVAVQVTTASGIGAAPVTLQVAAQRSLAVGQSLVLGAIADARCNEFAPDGGRYILTVQNAARAVGSGEVALTVTGVATGGSSTLIAPPPTLRATPSPRPAPAFDPARDQSAERRAMEAHARLMDANRALLESARPAAALRQLAPGAALVTPLPGAILPVRIAALGQPNFCNSYTSIGARAVFVGDRVVILEDTIPTLHGQPTLRGQMDNLYTALGAEIESTVWPIVQEFGDPLVMDSRLDANGRVFIVFSPQVNLQLGGAVLASVVTCDFFSRSQFASSNVGEFVYAQVPTSAAAGFGPGTRTQWLYEMRATIAHELKHVTSYGERIIRGQPLEEPWLEEATARHAEELFARAVFGTQRGANAGYAATLACEIGAITGVPGCAQAPRAMLPHFDGLWDFLDLSTQRTPLGPADAADFSFYGSAWALTRWILDQQALDEPTFFTGLTRSGQSGLVNLEGRVGRGWDEMLGEWSLAMATDDRAGLLTASPRVRFPSWNLTDVFGGLCGAIGSCGSSPWSPLRFARPYPLRPFSLTAGAFVVEVPSLAAGGFVAMDLAPPGVGTRELIELSGYRGAALPATARLAILRVQ